MRTLLVSFSVVCLTVAALGAEPIDFNRDIKPILSDQCYACHGPDATQRQGGGEDGLRLDTKEGAFADLDGHLALVPGDLEASELIRRISSEDPDQVMPPSDHRKSLTKQEKQILADWVRQGAIWSQHWAYVVPQRKDRPSGNWIDAMIRQHLSQRGLKQAPAASKRVLVRRAYFDVIGLPPSPAEVDEFLADHPTMDGRT